MVFSGNELSAIYAMGFCFAVLFFLKTKRGLIKWLMIPVLFLMILAMLNIGTKVAFGGAVIALLLGVVTSFWELIKKKQGLNLIIITAMTVVTLAISPFMAIGNNLGVSMDISQAPAEEETEEGGEEGAAEEGGSVDSGESPENVSEGPDLGPIQSFFLSGRESFFNDSMTQFQAAPVSQKILGMGRGGNYEETSKFIEMDFIDWFFNFGFVGFILLMIPLAAVGGASIINILKNGRLFSLNVLFSGLATCIGLGAAFTAGHVLSSPGAGIYLAVGLAFLFTMSMKKETGNRRW
nr:O-antigen ligase family protein [Sinobaca sp. H24]